VFQTQILSLCRRIAPQLLDAQIRFMQFLEKAGRLDRSLEYLPSDQDLAERRAAGQGLCSPELAVLLAYSKMWLYDELLASPLPDDPWVATALTRYFPHTLAERFSSYMPRHPLRREIIATHVINSMLNRVGPSFVYRVCESLGARPHEVVRAYLLAREVFGLVQLWVDIEALEGLVDDEVQGTMLIELSHHLERGATWFLRSARLSEAMDSTVTRFRVCVGDLAGQLPELLEQGERESLAQAAERYVERGVPNAVAMRVVSLSALTATLDIAEVADSAQQPVAQAAALYFELGARLGLPLVREHVQALPATQHWQMLAKAAMLDELSALQRAVTGRVLSAPVQPTGSQDRLAAWSQAQARTLERCAQLQAELRTARSIDLAMLSVLLREMRALA
jgi:glutamate dehydrogenase